MKIHFVFFSCFCTSLAITVHYRTSGSSQKNEKDKAVLKDIRLVPVNPPDALQKPITGRNKEANEVKNHLNPGGESKPNRENSRMNRGEKKKLISRIGHTRNDQNYQNYMQKMANQLYMVQKHTSVLSDYQKFILNQDQNIKNFVLAQSTQDGNAKQFSTQKPTGKALPVATKLKYVTPEPVVAADYKKIVVVSPKVQTRVKKIPQPQNDHSPQATHIKYVTLAPQSLTHFVESQELSPKVTLVPFHSSQHYTYYSEVTHKPQIETIQIPTTVPVGLGAYEPPQIYKSESRHEDNGQYDNAKYEFMYNVKEKHNHFGHRESRTNLGTFGYYFVHLPDGRLETVKYWADKTGYHAKVDYDYEGEAKHPTHVKHKLHSGNLVHHEGPAA